VDIIYQDHSEIMGVDIRGNAQRHINNEYYW